MFVLFRTLNTIGSRACGLEFRFRIQDLLCFGLRFGVAAGLMMMLLFAILIIGVVVAVACVDTAGTLTEGFDQ